MSKTKPASIPRCGDHVHHQPTDETWVVAYADEATGDMAWSGWPEGRARISDCRVVYRCTDDEHRTNVALWLKPGGDDHRRRAVARLYGKAGA